jgi:threonine synthase
VEAGLKLESLNPSGSYKDRGTAVLISQLLARGIRQAVEDSSGNAGASFAAYAARAGLKGKVFVPEAASGPKRTQIEQYGAELVRVPGPRSAAAAAVLQDVAKGATYASHAYMPFGLAGIATIAYEIWETLNGAPGTIIAPVGHGGLLSGIQRGFAALKNAGKVPRIPYWVGVQAAACAPCWEAYRHKDISAVDFAREDATVAEGVRVRKPVRASAILKEIFSTGGEVLAIDEQEILPAYHELAGRGFYVEPTSALVLCALRKLGVHLPKPVVMVISGSGLKYQPD